MRRKQVPVCVERTRSYSYYSLFLFFFIINYMGDITGQILMATLVRRYAKETEDFNRKFTRPQEDRHKFTGAPWTGGYRWVRSPRAN